MEQDTYMVIFLPSAILTFPAAIWKDIGANIKFDVSFECLVLWTRVESPLWSETE